MADEPAERPPLAEPVAEANWTLRVAVVVALLVFLVLGYLFGTTVLPRWWANRVGERVDGSITSGTFYGLFIGFVFTFVPLLILLLAFRKLSTKVRIALVVLALVVAIPNLITLSIVMGNGDGAHAGDRILDVNGPGFRVGSAWGAVVGVVLAVVVAVLIWRWRRDRRQLQTLRSEKKAVERNDRAENP